MGNYRSCACRNTNSGKVIAFNGRILEFQKPIKAAELMLENPQHFVCHSNALQTGHRIAALSADEELEQGNTYLLLPMDKLRSVVSPSDMAALALRSESSLVKVSSNSKVMAKIFPVLFGDIWQLPIDRKDGIATGELCKQQEAVKMAEFVVPKLRLDDVPHQQLGFVNERPSGCRYWKPVLEAIIESPRLMPGIKH
eukprot:Gb_05765 [translate_table: standard]